MASKTQRFRAELVMGHMNIAAVFVPFSPEETWGPAPTRMPTPRGRCPAWLVRGSVEERPFRGWIGSRYGRFFVIIDDEFQRQAGVAPGDTLSLVLDPAGEAMEAAPPARKRAVRKAAAKKARSGGGGACQGGARCRGASNRQWTLSFPHRVRWVMLRSPGLLSEVLAVFLRALFAPPLRVASYPRANRGISTWFSRWTCWKMSTSIAASSR